MISILKNIKAEGGLSEEAYKRMYPTGAVSPKFYGLPKIHKPGIPLRPVVSSTGTVTYNTAKELAKILKPLVGMSTHHVHNTRDFVEHLKDVRLRQGECIISYDVTALFTSVPIQHHPTEGSHGQGSAAKNHHVDQAHNQPFGILPEQHKLCSRGSITNK